MEYFEEMAERVADLAGRAGLWEIEIAELAAAVRDGGRRPVVPAHYLPHTVDTGLALRMVGLRETIHPRDAYAMVHRSVELADLGEFLNVEWYGHEMLAREPVDGGILVVLDLRPKLAAMGAEASDPADPDRWRPGQ